MVEFQVHLFHRTLKNKGPPGSLFYSALQSAIEKGSFFRECTVMTFSSAFFFDFRSSLVGRFHSGIGSCFGCFRLSDICGWLFINIFCFFDRSQN